LRVESPFSGPFAIVGIPPTVLMERAPFVLLFGPDPGPSRQYEFFRVFLSGFLPPLSNTPREPSGSCSFLPGPVAPVRFPCVSSPLFMAHPPRKSSFPFKHSRCFDKHYGNCCPVSAPHWIPYGLVIPLFLDPVLFGVCFGLTVLSRVDLSFFTRLAFHFSLP